MTESFPFRRVAALLALALFLARSVPADAGAPDLGRFVAGPVEARIVRVVDGDTILVDAVPWPQQSVRVYVRLRGIDAPELHARCASERAAAKVARSTLSNLVASDEFLRLRDVSGGKYFGRVLADVETPDGNDLSRAMLSRRLAANYSGGRRHSMCPKAG